MEVTPLIEDGEALSSMPGLGALERSAGGRHIAGVGEQSLHWFAAYTAPRHEKAVLRHLDVRHVESFLPLYTSVRRWKNGCRVAVEQPLFPGYVFVHIERRSWVKVLQVPGVVSLVSSGREPSALQTGEIESLRVGLPQRQYEPHPKVAVGDKVRIVEGPLAGMSGVLVRKKSDFRVVLTLELIMQNVAVEVGLDEVEPLRK